MGERFDMSRPIYAQIVERLKAKILAGSYPPGGHRDSVRDMAAAAGVNPNTMQRALTELERDGLVYSQRTSGRYVTEDQTAIMEARHALAADRVRSFLTDMERLGFEKEDLLSLLRQVLITISKNLMKTDLTMTILITILILTKRKKISPAARNAAMYRFVSLP